MVTVSHHTRACPQDISGLLTSAFPGSRCVVTVTLQTGFLAGERGKGAGDAAPKNQGQGPACAWLPLPITQPSIPKGSSSQGKVESLRHDSGRSPEATKPSLGQAEAMCPSKGMGSISFTSPATFSNPPPAPFLHQVSFQLDQLPTGAKPALCMPHSCLLCYTH